MSKKLSQLEAERAAALRAVEKEREELIREKQEKEMLEKKFYENERERVRQLTQQHELEVKGYQNALRDNKEVALITLITVNRYSLIS